MISMHFPKRMRRILSLAMAVCFLVIPAVSLNEAPEGGAEAAQPQAGEKHWYTFSVLPWGILSSTNVKFIALYEPCFISQKDAWAIGRVKGMSTEVNVYTSDPEERLIWSFSPDNFTGLFLRSGIALPDPDSDPDAGYFAVYADEVPEDLMNADPEKTQAVWGVFVYRELPMLQRWMLLGFVRNGDRLILLSWKETESGYEADRFVEIDPDSELYRLAAEAIDASGPEQP